MSDTNNAVPKHVAIIMDGNGRWAKKKHMPRNVGHAQGSKVVEQICEDAYNMGIEYLTIYAFSTENWNRPKDEVNALMRLLRSYLRDCIKRSSKNNMKVKVIGDITSLEEDLKDSIQELERVSASNTGLHFQVALNYGGRDEILRAVEKITNEVATGKRSADRMTEKEFESYLDTAGIPEPDLMIRTSGEVRLSNYLLWELAYTEFYFTEVLWPDFNKAELEKAVKYYQNRDRRFGNV